MIRKIVLSLFGISVMLHAQQPEIVHNLPPYYVQMKGQLSYPLAYQNSKKSFKQWRKEARAQLIELAQPFPPATPFKMQITDTEQRAGYKAHKITFQLSAYTSAKGYLHIPDAEGKHPAMLMLHDHGGYFSIGKEKMVKPFGVLGEVTANAQQWVERFYDGNYIGDEFAARGYVVLAIDALMWGERGETPVTQYDTQQALASNLMQMGFSVAGLMLHDDMRSAELLCTLPYVDATRVGAVGFSMGAYRAFMLSAATDVVSAAAALCWMNTTECLMVPENNQTRGGSSFSMLLPRLVHFMDYPHVASIAAPKPMLFFNGMRDKLFPVLGVEAAYKSIHEVWQSQRVKERLITKLWDEKHFFNNTMLQEVLEFFEENL